MINFGRGLIKEHAFEIILKSIHTFRTRSCLNVFLFFFLFFFLAQAVTCADRNCLINFGRGSIKEHAFEMVSKFVQQFQRWSFKAKFEDVCNWGTWGSDGWEVRGRGHFNHLDLILTFFVEVH